MKKKRSGIIWNKKKQNKNIVFIVLASIAAAVATAVVGLIKFRGRKNADDVKGAGTETAPKMPGIQEYSDASKESASAEKDDIAEESASVKGMDAARAQIISHIKHRKINPGELDWEVLAKEKETEQIRKGNIPDYMLEDVDRKPARSVKRRKWKKAAAGMAMVLAATLTIYPVMRHLRPAEAVAKESFAGIGKIVEEHGEDNPYKILDIVPSEAYYSVKTQTGGGSGSGGATGSDGTTDPDDTSNPDSGTSPSSFTFTTGTMGYLAGGKVPFADDLEKAFTSNAVFRHYAVRKDLLNALIPESSAASFPGIRYSEAYLGVNSVSEADGWKLLFPNQEVTVDDAYQITSTLTKAEMSEGSFRGEAVEYTAGEDKTGFDFVYSDGTIKSSNKIPGLSSRYVYILNVDEATGISNWYPVTLDMYYTNYMPHDIPAWILNEEGIKTITIGESGPDCDLNAYVYRYNEDGTYSPVDIARNVPELFIPLTQQPDDSNAGTGADDNTNTDDMNGGSTNTDDTDNTDTNNPDNNHTDIDNSTESGNDGENADTGNTGESTGDTSGVTGGSTDNSAGNTGEGTENTETNGETTENTGSASGDGTTTDTETQTPTDQTTSTSTTSTETTESGDAVSVISVDLPDIAQNMITGGRWHRLVEDGSEQSNPPDSEQPTPAEPNPGQPQDPAPEQPPEQPAPPATNPDQPQNPAPPATNPDQPQNPAPPVTNPDQPPDPAPPATNPDQPQNPAPDQPPEQPVPPENNQGQPQEPVPDQPTDTTVPGGVQSEEFFILDWDSFTAVDGVNLPDMLGADTLEEESLEDEALMEAEDGISLLADSTSQNYDASFIYVGPGMGNYKLTETDADTDMLIGVYNAPIYFRCRGTNDWLRQYVFGSLTGGDNANSSFRIEVQTVRADEVTAEMVSWADLIYLESGQNMFLSPSLAVRYIQHGEDDSILEDINDMSAGIVSAILERAADDLTPVIVDYAITEATEDTYAGTNYQLLAKALLKRDLAGYFEAVNTGSDLMANIEMTLEADDYPDKEDNGYNYVNQNVYIVNDDEMLVSEDFATFFDEFKAKAGFSDVLAAIDAENTTLAEYDRIYPAVSKARAIQYIINFSVGIMGEFDDLTILELQPTANIDLTSGGVRSDLYTEVDSKEHTKLVWKTEAMKTGKQILNSKNQFSIKTDVKSVVEFNGEWEDVNGVYDMIFIGLDGRNLNLSEKGGTLYNNTDLNGKVYHLGDESGVGTYDSNDITAQKMTDLLEYLHAGYPIVVENDFFTDGTARGATRDTINTKYVAGNTVMFKFLLAAVTEEDYQDSIFTVADTMSNAGFMARMKTSKPRIELVDENADNDSETSQEPGVIQRLTLDENEEYHGRIGFRIKNNRGEDYYGNTTMHLYADMNYDGFFSEKEELGEEFGAYVNEGNVIDVAISGMGPGIIPWKLEVTDTGNEYRRSSVQGYFELTSTYEEEIRVLQVTTSKGNPFIDLETMCKTKKDSVLASLLKDAPFGFELGFTFEAVTPAELTKNLTKNPNYLKLWDIVVLTVDDGVTVDNAALMEYINEGRSLLVCSQNKGGNLAGLSKENAASVLGWTKELEKTYVSLGAASQYHRYAGLTSGMYDAGRAGWRADKINEGSILYYPYEMAGSSFAFAEKMEESGTGLRASDYLLNFENNLKSEKTEAFVTTWLTFGGNKDTAYGISPKDARNNYYCYSKGNVVYLAQSEYPYIFGEGELAANVMGADECKFFVNALMAAYSAGVHSSDVSIVSGFAQNSAPMKSIAVPFDQEWRDTADDTSEGILDNTVDVYFKFADSNIGANKNVKVSFFYEDPAGAREFVIGDRTVKAKPFGSDIWTVTDNKLVPVTGLDPQNPDAIGLVPGKVYRIKAPVVSLRTLTDDKTNDAGIFVLVESEFTRTGKTYHIEGFGTVSLNRARLFLLE